MNFLKLHGGRLWMYVVLDDVYNEHYNARPAGIRNTSVGAYR